MKFAVALNSERIDYCIVNVHIEFSRDLNWMPLNSADIRASVMCSCMKTCEGDFKWNISRQSTSQRVPVMASNALVCGWKWRYIRHVRRTTVDTLVHSGRIFAYAIAAVICMWPKRVHPAPGTLRRKLKTHIYWLRIKFAQKEKANRCICITQRQRWTSSSYFYFSCFCCCCCSAQYFVFPGINWHMCLASTFAPAHRTFKHIRCCEPHCKLTLVRCA